MEQVIGRVIRMCVHKDVINDNNKFPLVNVYRYVVSLNNNELSSDEILYQKAELKYLTIKEIEYGLKQVSLDCPLLLNANMFPEEIEKYKNCVPPTLENIKLRKTICPALCDFKKCEFKCETKLNWDDENITYKYLGKNDIDYNTFNEHLAQFEIEMIKNKIRDLFKYKHVYVYGEILEEIKKSFLNHQSELFEYYFLDQALFDMMPVYENDFNTFKDTIFDKYNRPGYIISRGKYYIFQPIHENEEVGMYYRQTMNYIQGNQVSLDNYIKSNFPNKDFGHTTIDNIQIKDEYNFEDTLNYYDNRDENFIIGIIDKNTNKLTDNEPDLFKIRYPKSNTTIKKRGTGIPTFKGAVCATAKDKNYLMKIIKKIPDISKNEIDKINKLTRDKICDELKNKLLYLEKYSTTKDQNKMTYVIIPYNHPIYPFPYNLEDRIKLTIKKIKNLLKSEIEILVKKQKDNDNNIIYELTFSNNKLITEIIKDIESLGFNLNNNLWITILK
jgi:hypothetical protein